MLEIARAKNFKLNKEKCKVGLEEIKNLGHIFTKDGLKPDQTKIEAVLNANSRMQERCGTISGRSHMSRKVHSKHVQAY